jgi:hypothetical protein
VVRWNSPVERWNGGTVVRWYGGTPLTIPRGAARFMAKSVVAVASVGAFAHSRFYLFQRDSARIELRTSQTTNP